jgi:hypothetical protein
MSVDKKTDGEVVDPLHLHHDRHLRLFDEQAVLLAGVWFQTPLLARMVSRWTCLDRLPQ